METLGERIRKLRKQRKLTLEALAGDELTKGMLSLIENNKANPSMESLSYIAERLGVEVVELLEEVSTYELRALLEKAEILYNTEFDVRTDEYTQLITLVEPYVPKLTQGYESARLLEIYSRCIYYEKKSGWQVFSDRAATMYDLMNIIPRRASIGIFRAFVKFTEHNYAQSLSTLLHERSEIEARNAFIDPMTRLDLDYMEAVLLFAVGDSESAIRVMKSGIEFSRQERVFYRIDHLYRLATAHAIMEEDEDQYAYYLKKLTQYGDFTEDKEAIFFTKFAEVHYLNSFKKSYKEAQEQWDQFLDKGKYSNDYSPFINLEKGKSFFGLNEFEHALVALEKVKIADYTHHPFDLSIFYEKDAYKALCYMELGNLIEARRLAGLAMQNISVMPRTPYKDFILETYELLTK
ncbi:helix-turn-helix domain-containing protein [Sporosarcina psychrophila]|uniref:helix-turn-helix domain-containing protein n=1 Tax=Sporosarcina psychrophila TaxID=1476 RepID=UPI00078C7E83|nr:helix-turn-helix transcriptional regulator [Sporosarcina psychrophila]AMQ04931.1 transcriptional regulator [Sporosarcina psychrophila]